MAARRGHALGTMKRSPRPQGAAVKFTPDPATATRATTRLPGSQGYRLSSDELHSGLDVEPVLFTSLPPETIKELVRMRKTWGPTSSASGPDSRSAPL